jgi:hypothetical protein
MTPWLIDQAASTIMCMRTGARAGGHDYGNNQRSRASFGELKAGDYFVILG